MRPCLLTPCVAVCFLAGLAHCNRGAPPDSSSPSGAPTVELTPGDVHDAAAMSQAGATHTTGALVDVSRSDTPGGIEAKPLQGKVLAILATDGVEQVELTEPRRDFHAAGAETVLVAPHPGTIQAMDHADKGAQLKVDMTIDDADPARFSGLVLPGGVANPDALRANPKAVEFVRSFVIAGKPIAAICHGPWTLIEAAGVRGKRVTSWPSLRTDLTNAGATWIDAPVVDDHGLVTSRKPDDIPAFVQSAITEFGKI